jgi:hypothetical protein
MTDILRRAVPADAQACSRICHDAFGALADAHRIPRNFGFDRGGELKDAIGQNTATVVEHLGGISGYATLVGLLTLMTTGLYNEPAGAYLPSILY